MRLIARAGGVGGRRKGAGRRSGPSPGPEALHAARRRKEIAVADLRELEVGAKSGRLVSVDDVLRDWSGTLRRIRAAVLAVPSRLRRRLPHLTPNDIAALDRELRDTLTALTDEQSE
jgi:phage terminase Nu1 subunit (DNA packaging protein)